ncbi:F0F1 ATP synthase subunit B [Mesorhizobium microcysteis]|jgi:F-type H+-transporting ATPase subunit b|uniref:ATP synthase subunit b n=1 Tax=Neoaquamicrobium microcysteis TaxID=2682781 RepID=A0A5D4GUW2_9HYPH|nr:F0F1 ATP synthase subunit B [Mesorhizobium microcysteis]TYR31924.1 F0F1 ATP synthase subunit B [Mesorhizobium microcysteis]
MFVAPAFAQELETEADQNGHTEVGVEHGSTGVFPPFDSSTYPSQLLWLAITFGLFYLFLKKVVLPRIGGILEVRSDRIAQDLDQAARLKEESDAALAAYEQELADAKAKAGAIGQEARDVAKAEADAERKKVEASLESRLSEAEARIALIKDAAMRDVSQIAEETTGLIVQELLGSKTDKAAVSAAVKAVRG